MLDDIEELLELPEIREVSTQSLRAEGRVRRRDLIMRAKARAAARLAQAIAEYRIR